MDGESRERFWKTLLSLHGADREKDAQALIDVIQYPKYLYRFRPMSVSSLDSLQNNRMYFSSADHYDDPFDSFLHINVKQIEETIDRIFEKRASLESSLSLLAGSFGATKEGINSLFKALKSEQIKKSMEIIL